MKDYILNDDKMSLAELIDYPINVTIDSDEVTIDNSEEFVENYDKIVNPTFKEAISKASVKEQMILKQRRT